MQFAGNLLGHAIINAAARENDLGIIAKVAGAAGQIERVNTNAMPAHKAGAEG